MPKKIATEYEVVRHGLMHSDCFQGCSEGSEFDAVYTGNGDNPADALNDALENAGSAGWDTSIVTDKLPDTPSVSKQEQEECEQAKEEALERWIAKQEEAGKVNIDTATEEELAADPETFSPDDFEWDEDRWKDRHGRDNWYYVSVRLKADDESQDTDDV